MHRFDSGEDGEEDRPDYRAYGEEYYHLAREAEEVDEYRQEGEGGNILQDVEEGEEEVGKRTPAHKKGDGDAKHERNSVGKDESVGSTEQGLGEREPAHLDEVAKGSK